MPHRQEVSMGELAARIMAARQGIPHLFFLGQAGFIIKSSKGTTLGIDMYLTECVERAEGNDGFKRLLPVLLEPSEIIFDYIIATHPHYDHFDMDAIPILMGNPHTQLLASVNCEREVRRLLPDEEGSASRIRYVRAGDTTQLEDIRVDYVFCDHGEGAPDAFGLVLETDGRRIYVAGDTCLRLDRVSEIAAKGPFDYMIAPINGAYGNLNEEECVRLSKALKPKVTIPCHYGMFASHGGNPGIFRESMIRELPHRKYLLMRQGESIEL